MYGGGCALNSVANRRILKETPFDEIYINPAAVDGGTAVGAALYGYHALLGKPRHFIMEHAYWGQEHSRKDTALYLKENDIPFEYLDDDKLIARVTEGIVQGKVVGWH